MSKSDISDVGKSILEIDSRLVDLSVKVSGTPYLATLHDTRTSLLHQHLITPRRKSNEKFTTHQTIATPHHKSTDIDLFTNETEPSVILQQQRHRMQAFVDVFFQCETIFGLGCLICFDEFLFVLTWLPLRFIKGVFRALTGGTWSRTILCDFLHIALLLICTRILLFLDLSYSYHSIRGQSSIKLYVLVQMLQVFDKMCFSFGSDTLGVLFNSIRLHTSTSISNTPWHSIIWQTTKDFLVAIIYCVLHSGINFIQVVSIQVALNSRSNMLFSVLISSNFAEIKTSVFKKNSSSFVFQIVCSDIIERFQLFVFLLIIAVQQGMSAGWDSLYPWIFTTPYIFLAIVGSEILVDWLKHVFIINYNHLSPSMYGRWHRLLCREFLETQIVGNQVAAGVTSRIGFVASPLVILFLRTMWPMIRNNQFHLDSYMLWLIAFTTILFVLLLKWCLSIGLKRYSQWHSDSEKIESQLGSTEVASSISTPTVDTTTPLSLDDTPDGVLCMPPTPHHHPIRRHSHTIAPAHINAIAKLSRGLAHTEYSKRRVKDSNPHCRDESSLSELTCDILPRAISMSNKTSLASPSLIAANSNDSIINHVNCSNIKGKDKLGLAPSTAHASVVHLHMFTPPSDIEFKEHVDDVASSTLDIKLTDITSSSSDVFLK